MAVQRKRPVKKAGPSFTFPWSKILLGVTAGLVGYTTSLFIPNPASSLLNPPQIITKVDTFIKSDTVVMIQWAVPLQDSSSVGNLGGNVEELQTRVKKLEKSLEEERSDNRHWKRSYNELKEKHPESALKFSNILTK